MKLTHPLPVTRPFLDEQQVRQQIDRAVGRALVDHSFAARLLAHPALAVEASTCKPAQYLAVRQIHAHELDDFARQAFEQFWGPAQRPQPTSRASAGNLEATS
jgi:hypothetical protein